MLSMTNLGRGSACPPGYTLETNADGVWLCYPRGEGRPIPTQNLRGLGDALPTCSANPLCDPASGACADAITGAPCMPAAAAPSGGSNLGLYITSGLVLAVVIGLAIAGHGE